MYHRNTIKAAFVASLPVLMGYSTMGAAFGILLNKAGFSPWWALFLCVTILSGSLQFAAVGMLQQGMGLVETAVMSLLINIRYCMYGLSLIEPFRSCGWKRFYMIFTLTDETYALQVQDERPEGVSRNDYMFLLGLFNHVYWVIGGVIGAIAGTLVEFDSSGIDFAMTALFLVILTEQCRERYNRLPALIGGVSTLLALWTAGSERMLLPAMCLLVAVLILLRPFLDDRRKREAAQ